MMVFPVTVFAVEAGAAASLAGAVVLGFERWVGSG